jgi:hypothetical protein
MLGYRGYVEPPSGRLVMESSGLLDQDSAKTFAARTLGAG